MANKNAHPLFNFYEVVQIISVKPKLRDIDKMFGVVVGMAESHDGGWNYTVGVYEDEQLAIECDAWSIDEIDLVKTGRFVDESFVMSGTSIVVSAEGEPKF